MRYDELPGGHAEHRRRPGGPGQPHHGTARGGVRAQAHADIDDAAMAVELAGRRCGSRGIYDVRGTGCTPARTSPPRTHGRRPSPSSSCGPGVWTGHGGRGAALRGHRAWARGSSGRDDGAAPGQAASSGSGAAVTGSEACGLREVAGEAAGNAQRQPIRSGGPGRGEPSRAARKPGARPDGPVPSRR
ncbi:hypothetical protein QJS66_21150 [Kocuria rhizophila]|nr:hypothetical protein QJS66_21150 [Kocuria rhizophila]